MALTDFQYEICRLIADNRRRSGQSYVAGGVALNELLHGSRLSRDIGLFHDAEAAVAAAWECDRAALAADGIEIEVIRQRPGFVEIVARRAGHDTLMQWTRDSAFRFFPLIEHQLLGLTLHPFDLATNKVLALVGRLEVRDWVDLIACDQRIQPLGYLAWAACAKDPGFSPVAIMAEASRTAHYSSAEIDTRAFAGPSPDAVELAQRWHEMLRTARSLIDMLPAENVGCCVLAADGSLFRGDPVELAAAVRGDRLIFHQGRLYGAFPSIV